MDGEVRMVACFFCHMNCGTLVRVEGGRVTEVRGDPSHPNSQGTLCPRGNIALRHLNHPSRVNYPLKRSGERGAGQWQRVSWDQALDEISARLASIRADYGAEAVASAGGTHRTDDWARRRFFNLFGSPNVFHTSHVCWIPTFVIETAIYGWCAFDADLPQSRCIVLWGHNPAASYMPEMRGLLDVRAATGAKLIVIDPRLTETAAKADLWLPLRPGTDGALALAWLNVILTEGLYDAAFVENWTVGLGDLWERVQPYTPEWASGVTGLAAEKIYASARLYATHRPGSILWGLALDQVGRAGGAASHARALLRAVTGNLDCPGGDLLCGPHPSMITDEEMELNDLLPPEQRAKQLGSDRFKLMAWPGYQMLSDQLRPVWGKTIPAEWTCEAHGPTVFRTILSEQPYPVKALLVLADNPLLSYPNSRKVYEALRKLDLVVVMDYWLTPSAMLADYVLPAAGWLERPTMTTTYGCTDWFIASERGIPPLYERRTDYEFWRELGLRLGQAEHWPWRSLEEVFFARLPEPYHALGSYEEFVHQVRMDFAPREYYKYAARGFATPSGKVELRSSILEALGYDPLPHYEEPAESPVSTPELTAEYPLILMAAGGFMPFYHSEHRQIAPLRLLHYDPWLEINPETAEALAIRDGEWVTVETRRGRIRQRARLTQAVAPGVVRVERGWWFPERVATEPELYGVWASNANVLTDDDPEACDPLTGSWSTRALLCRVSRDEGGE